MQDRRAAHLRREVARVTATAAGTAMVEVTLSRRAVAAVDLVADRAAVAVDPVADRAAARRRTRAVRDTGAKSDRVKSAFSGELCGQHLLSPQSSPVISVSARLGPCIRVP
jgi:hypothetical protein